MNYEEEFRKYLKEKAQKSKVNAEKEINANMRKELEQVNAALNAKKK